MTPAEKQAAWEKERAEIVRARYAYEDRCRNEGRDVPRWEPLPLEAPEWFLRPATTGTLHELRPKAADPNVIHAREGVDVLGRPFERPKHVEEIFPRRTKPYGQAQSPTQESIREAPMSSDGTFDYDRLHALSTHEVETRPQTFEVPEDLGPDDPKHPNETPEAYFARTARPSDEPLYPAAPDRHPQPAPDESVEAMWARLEHEPCGS